jgi:hypothetical protein
MNIKPESLGQGCFAIAEKRADYSLRSSPLTPIGRT